MMHFCTRAMEERPVERAPTSPRLYRGWWCGVMGLDRRPRGRVPAWPQPLTHPPRRCLGTTSRSREAAGLPDPFASRLWRAGGLLFLPLPARAAGHNHLPASVLLIPGPGLLCSAGAPAPSTPQATARGTSPVQGLSALPAWLPAPAHPGSRTVAHPEQLLASPDALMVLERPG